MPLIRVELFDYRMNDETSAALIEKLTDALCEATHPGLRDHTWVIVEGHNPKNWGLGGKPWPVDEMPPAPARAPPPPRAPRHTHELVARRVGVSERPRSRRGGSAA